MAGTENAIGMMRFAGLIFTLNRDKQLIVAMAAMKGAR